MLWLAGSGGARIESLTKEPEVRKALTKLAFAEEWAASLRDSHPESDAREAALANFEKERTLLVQNLSKAFPELSQAPGAMPPYQQAATWL